MRGDALTTLSGSLRFADGSSPAGATVQILYSTGGGAGGALVASAACGADGRWSADLALHASGTAQARFAGDGARPALASQPLDITRQARAARRGLAGRTSGAGASSRCAAGSRRRPTR